MARTVRPCNKQNLLISGARVCMCMRARARACVSMCAYMGGGGGYIPASVSREGSGSSDVRFHFNYRH